MFTVDYSVVEILIDTLVFAVFLLIFFNHIQINTLATSQINTFSIQIYTFGIQIKTFGIESR